MNENETREQYASRMLKQICEDVYANIGDISDGYRTFNQLYYQRMILSAVIINHFSAYYETFKSTRHSNGEECFGGGWFIVGIKTPYGWYTYHYEMKDWDLFKCPVRDRAPEWDGHTEEDVTRLLSL